MINKKGFLLLEKNVVELVIAGLGILVVFALAVYIFNAFSAKQDVRNAQTALDIISVKVGAVTDMQNAEVQIRGPCKTTPCNWYMDSYGINDNKKPDECGILKSCICFCDGNAGKDEKCYGKKVCGNFDLAEIEIKPKQFVNFYADPEGIGRDEYSSYNRTVLKPNLNKYLLSKTGSKLVIEVK